MGSEYSKEINLAAELNAVCDESGKEVDVAKSAPIFHQFGKLYRNRSPDKISLIQSSVFFNAALARQPSNCNAKKDLEELCLHVLTLAGVKHRKKNTIEFLSLDIQRKILTIRIKTQKQLQNLQIIPIGLPLSKLSKLKEKKITVIKNIQATITNSFIDVMNDVASHCIDLLGRPP